MIIRLRYIASYTSRGREYLYYRRGNYRVRLRRDDGSPVQSGDPDLYSIWQAADAAYNRGSAALARSDDDAQPLSIYHLIATYLDTPEWRALSPRTQRDYRRYLDVIRDVIGRSKVSSITRQDVLDIRNSMSGKPRTATYIVQVISRLYGWALDTAPKQWGINVNPAAGIRKINTPRNHRPWGEDEIRQYQARWRQGTIQRTIYDLLLWTGQRGGDINNMTWGQVMAPDGAIRPELIQRQAKTGAVVVIPISPDLADTLAAWRDLDHRMANDPLIPGGIDNQRHIMARSYQDAGLSDVTSHGLRYTAATRLREVGMDPADIAAVTGHRAIGMARQYSAQRRAAKIGLDKITKATKRT